MGDSELELSSNSIVLMSLLTTEMKGEEGGGIWKEETVGHVARARGGSVSKRLASGDALCALKMVLRF